MSLMFLSLHNSEKYDSLEWKTREMYSAFFTEIFDKEGKSSPDEI